MAYPYDQVSKLLKSASKGVPPEAAQVIEDALMLLEEFLADVRNIRIALETIAKES